MSIALHDSFLRSLLKNVYFINGTAYAGKSTMVRMLAQKHGGIHCGENFHMPMMEHLDPADFPNACYFRTLTDWAQFLRRTPEEYAAWISGSSREAVEMELVILLRLTGEHPDTPIFVDSNIPADILRRIAAPNHVALMLCPPEVSVACFFERGDVDKQFLLGKIRELPDADDVMANFRACIAKINSQENYDAFVHSGLYTLLRDDSRSPEETLRMLEQHFNLI